MTKILGLGAYRPFSNPLSLSPITRPTPYKTIVSDTFLPPINGIPLSTHDPEVGTPPWLTVATMDDHDVNLSLGGAIGPSVLTNTNGNKIDLAHDDYIIRASIQWPAGVPDNTRYLGIFTRGDFRIVERMDGVVFGIFEGATLRSFMFNASPLSSSTPYEIKATCEGSTITATIDGTDEITYGAAGAGTLAGVYGVPWSPSGSYIVFNFEAKLI